MDPNDPDVIALSKAIFKKESNFNYNAVGDAGTSHGAGQWQPETWKAQAKDVLGDPNAPMTPDNQKAVIQVSIAKDKAAGLNPAQIAAKWNSGSPTGWENKVGTAHINGQDVPYNVPQYVKDVTDYYHQYKGGSALPPPGAQPAQAAEIPGFAPPQQPTGPQAPSPTAPQASSGGGIGGLIKKAGNFLFPIAGDVYHDIKGDNSKTVLQQAGDLGLSALPFIPGLGEAGEGARLGVGAGKLGADFIVDEAGNVAKAAAPAAETATKGLLSKFTGSTVAKNAAVGYGAGVASNLGQGQGIGQALTPQLSNVGGAVLGGGAAALLPKLGGFFGDTKAISAVQKAYEDAIGGTQAGLRASSKLVTDTGESPAEFLAHSGIAPETEEINGRRVFTTGEDSNTYKAIQERASALTNLRDNLIERIGSQDLGNGLTLETPVSSLADLRQKILDRIPDEFMGTDRAAAIKHIDNEFSALSEQLGGDQIHVKDLNKVKMFFQGNSKYDATRPGVLTQANRVAASVARKQVEDDAERLGVPGIKEINKLIRTHLAFLNTDGKKGILHKLNGKVVKGGRIGQHVKEAVGGVMGGAVGNSLGGGLFGEIAGTAGGAYAGHLLSRIQQYFAAGGGRAAARFGKMAQEEPEVVKNLIDVLLQKGGEAPGQVAPRLRPGTNPGLVRPGIQKALIRVGASL